jgi:hypothetical protein
VPELYRHVRWKQILDSLLEVEPNPEPQVEMQVTVRLKAGKVEGITVDSVGRRYAALADTLAAWGGRNGVFPGIKDSAYRLKFVAFNYSLEK